jgi:hypothetical protein
MSVVAKKLRAVAADAMNELAQVTNRIERRGQQLEDDRRRQQEIIREAHKANVSVATLARLAHLSEARIYQILAEKS